MINAGRFDIFQRLPDNHVPPIGCQRMPTYEYRCRECGTDFEKFQRMSDEPVAECPKCGARAERRLSAGAGLLFKGSGFYITDYRGDSYKKAAEGEKSGGSTSGGDKPKSSSSSSSSSDSSSSSSSKAAASSGGKSD